MKITHNKVGQNLNLVDGLKQDKADSAKAKAGIDALGTNNVDLIGRDSSRVDVSDRAQEAKRIKELAMAAPDLDMAKVEKFRKLIDEGTYKVDAKAVADRMVDEHLEVMD